jgi:hypothetical protein
MNDDLTPFEPDRLDELLSAALDGEFDAAARDLGLSVYEASARLRASPGADARRDALASARELLAESPALDELLAARLRAKALRASEEVSAARANDRKLRRNRLLLRAGGVAATIAAVVAIGFGMSGHYSSSNVSSAKPLGKADTAPGRALTPKTHKATVNSPVATPALGAFTNVRELAQAAVARGTVPASHSSNSSNSSDPTAAQGFDPAVPATTTAGPTGGQLSAPAEQSAADSVARAKAQYGPAAKNSDCAPPLQVPGSTTPVLRSTATLSGKPVIVLVFAGNGEHIVVIEDTNCTLLNLQMLS